MVFEHSIREIKITELSILADLLYEMIFQAEGSPLLSREVIYQPRIINFIQDFGFLRDDYCLVAEVGGKIAGAVWIRILNGETMAMGYGYVDSETPELGISLFEEYRGKGIGHVLINEMLDYMRKKKYKQVSLCVDKKNPALKLYRKTGFEILMERDHDYLMVCKL